MTRAGISAGFWGRVVVLGVASAKRSTLTWVLDSEVARSRGGSVATGVGGFDIVLPMRKISKKRGVVGLGARLVASELERSAIVGLEWAGGKK